MDMDDVFGIGKFIAGGALVIFGIYSCDNSEWHKENMRQDAIEAQREATPHVIREADGCKVYAFKSAGSYHYFTRCGSTVTTERNYTSSKPCGKSTCSEAKQEVIVTEANK